MKKRIYKYFFYEFIHYFVIVLFALVAVIWTIQAVNFLDLVTNDGHAFRTYIWYSILTIPKIFTKLIPFAFLSSLILTILKLEKDNELIILWTSGLNKIHIVNLIFRISLIIMFLQLVLSLFVNPYTLNISRNVIKNSELQFIPSLLKVKQFNDTVEGLTVFVEEKDIDGTYKNIFIRDDGKILTQVSTGSSTIFAKSGYILSNEKKLILFDGNIQKTEKNNEVSVVAFKKTTLNLSGLTTKSISEIKIQETSTINIINCLLKNDNCSHRDEDKNFKIEINKRLGIPTFIPLIGMIICFLLSGRKEKKFSEFQKYIYFSIGFIILIFSEIAVRYSGTSFNNTLVYYFIPFVLPPLVYLFLIKTFKYENLN